MATYTEQHADGDSNAGIKGTVALGDDGTNLQTIKTDSDGNAQVDVLTMPEVVAAFAVAMRQALVSALNRQLALDQSSTGPRLRVSFDSTTSTMPQVSISTLGTTATGSADARTMLLMPIESMMWADKVRSRIT